ncbi:MAG: MoaD/ThiS family protein [Archaeoglobales archaeon]|nr:MoaD/ThiS family protein [Archaeoglobales archaeon]
MKLRLILFGFQKKEVEVEVDGKKSYAEILESIGINPETVVVLKDSTPVPNESPAEVGEVKVIRVISGG